jgi:hypothetical protein
MRTLHDHEINDFNSEHVKVFVADKADHEKGGGAHHHYIVGTDDGRAEEAHIHFQHGPVLEHGVNGITNEALIAVVLDRLRAFQRGPFASRENAVTVTKLEEALMWQHKRTLDRMRRGVEGRHEA